MKIPETWYVNFIIIFVPFKRRLEKILIQELCPMNKNLNFCLKSCLHCRSVETFVGKLQLDFKNLPKIKQLSDFNGMFSTYEFMNEFVDEKEFYKENFKE